MDKNKINTLFKNYYSPSLPGSYSGFETFLKALQDRKFKIKREDLKDWLKTQPTYTHHVSVNNKFKRNKVFVTGIDDLWQIDLCDLTNISKENDGYTFLITCIDVFSKFAWVKPIKSKSAANVLKGMADIFKNGRLPKKIQSDDGKEFQNNFFKNFLKDKNILLYKVNSELKACVVERFNRTLKEKMWRYFTQNNCHRYIDILDDLVYNYNNTYHSTIKCKPTEVSLDNELKIWNRLYGINQDAKIKFKYKKGDRVLISKDKKLFSKGYERKWVREIFEIEEKLLRNPPVYKLKDLNGESIEGVFYENNLQKIKY